METELKHKLQIRRAKHINAIEELKVMFHRDPELSVLRAIDAFKFKIEELDSLIQILCENGQGNSFS